MNWQAKYFDEDYIQFYDQVITPARTQQEVDFLQSIFNETTRTVLDMPCGFGRHSIELAKRRYEVTGVDAFESQLRVAKENGRNVPNLTLVKADMRNYTSSGFDAVVHMFSSFGYFSYKEDVQVLKNLVTSAKSDNGTIIIDVRNPTLLVEEMRKNGWKIQKDDSAGQSIEIFDPESRRLTMVYTRQGITKQAQMNIYALEEYAEWFKEFHCSLEATYGDYKGGQFSPAQSPRLIMVARRHK